MRKLAIIITLLVVVIGVVFTFFNPMAWVFAPRSVQEPVATTTTPTVATTTQSQAPTSTGPVQVVAENLSVPWGVAFMPSGNLLVTERTGRLVEFNAEGNMLNQNDLAGVSPRGEGGLLGLTLHPDFADNRQLYVYETYQSDQGTRNRVVRYTYQAGELSEQTVIIADIPGANYHDGGRIAFGSDGKHLFITTGDAGNPQQAQATSTRNGKILRLNPDGSIPASNPFDNSVYSYGHRNPQGISWDQEGRLWSTEHGRSGLRSGLDEVNLISSGSNYGWPYLEGEETCNTNAVYDPALPESIGDNCRMRSPVTHSGPEITWAPASAAITNQTLFFGGLRGQAIYTAPLISSGTEVRIGQIQAYFKERFGRIRTVKIGPAKEFLYLTTSNTDGRGNPKDNDDKVIQINLNQFAR